jgi:hypothetical protein
MGTRPREPHAHPSRIMSATEQLHPEYVTDGDGNRKSVILPIGEYEQLLEDLEDLAAIAERRDEPTLSHEALVEELKADGLLLPD